jgi:ABC-type phosphate transport system auxiliary subunit
MGEQVEVNTKLFCEECGLDDTNTPIVRMPYDGKLHHRNWYEGCNVAKLNQELIELRQQVEQLRLENEFEREQMGALNAAIHVGYRLRVGKLEKDIDALKAENEKLRQRQSGAGRAGSINQAMKNRGKRT